MCSSSFSRSPGSPAERISTARIPAFLAPPRATVATGTPAGICSMESTESHPSIEFEDLIGTPITGRGETDATIPGRWAAPPAPAIITLIPLRWAFEEKSISRPGVLCAETTVTSWPTPNSSSASHAPAMTSRSESEPITTLTAGVFTLSPSGCPL